MPSAVVSSAPVVKLVRLGRIGYRPALAIQQRLADGIKGAAGKGQPRGHTLLVLEHDPVYTTGIRTDGYPAAEEARLTALGAEFARSNRGGLITFHGPGQLVAYPVLDLADGFVPRDRSHPAARKALVGMKWYLGRLEQAVIDACAALGLPGARRSPDTGVWVDGPGGGGAPESKICAMGVHNSGFVTTHGLALNCNNDLVRFEINCYSVTL